MWNLHRLHMESVQSVWSPQGHMGECKVLQMEYIPNVEIVKTAIQH